MKFGCGAVLLKGGHGKRSGGCRYLLRWARRIMSCASRGLKRATRMAPAARCRLRSPPTWRRGDHEGGRGDAAKLFVWNALTAGARTLIGSGNGPVDHPFALRETIARHSLTAPCLRSARQLRVAGAHSRPDSHAIRRRQDLRREVHFGSLRAASATFADEATPGGAPSCFEGLETELGKNRSASAGRFFVAQVAHAARFQPLRANSCSKVRLSCADASIVADYGVGTVCWRSGGEGYMQSAQIRTSNAFRVLWCRSALRWAATATAASAGGFAHQRAVDGLHGLGVGRRRRGRQHRLDVLEPGCAASLPGINTESSYTLILPNSTSTVTGVESPFGSGPVPPGTPGASSGNVGIDAATGASYGTYQVLERPLAWYGAQLAVRSCDQTR